MPTVDEIRELGKLAVAAAGCHCVDFRAQAKSSQAGASFACSRHRIIGKVHRTRVFLFRAGLEPELVGSVAWTAHDAPRSRDYGDRRVTDALET